MTYASTYGNGNYAGVTGSTADATALTALGTPGLVDTVMATGTKSGYNFKGGRAASTTTTPATFFFTANPTTTSGVTQTGSRRFGIATDGVLMADATAANLATLFTDVTLASATPLSN